MVHFSQVTHILKQYLIVVIFKTVARRGKPVFAEMEDLLLGSDGQLECKETARQAHTNLDVVGPGNMCLCWF